MRPSWERPVAWAGLDKQPPTPGWTATALRERSATVDTELAEAEARLGAQVAALRAAFEGQRATAAQGVRVRTAVEESQAQVDETRARVAALRAEQEAVAAALAAPLPPDPVHAHLRHRSVPDVDVGKPVNWLLRLWSTVSVSLLLIGLAAVIYFDLDRRLLGLVAVVIVVLAIDAAIRGHFATFMAGFIAFAVVVGSIWLLLTNFRTGTAMLLTLGAIGLLLSNLGAYLRSR